MSGRMGYARSSALLTLLAGNADNISRFISGGPIGKAIHTFYHLMRPNTREGHERTSSRITISAIASAAYGSIRA